MIRRIVKKICTREIISYLICGVLTTLVGFGVYTLCVYLKLYAFNSETLLPQIISSVIAIIFAYIVNKIFVFESRSWSPPTLLREIVPFTVGRGLTFFMETGLLILLVDIMGLPNLICKPFTLVLVMITNYVISKFAVFKKRDVRG